MRQVGGAVGDDGDPLRALEAVRLQLHVVGFHTFDRRERCAGIEELLRCADVRMHAHPRTAAGEHHRIRADRLQRCAQGIAFDRHAALTVDDQQTFGAPATVGVNLIVGRMCVGVVVVLVVDGLVRRAQLCMQAHRARATFDEFGDTFKQIDEALRAGIHHAGLLQQRHLLRRMRQRALRRCERAGETAAGVVLQLDRRFLHRVGKAVDHAEDRAFHRMRQRAAGAVGAVAHRRGQGCGVQRRLCAGVLGHAMQKLGEDRPGIAARAVDRIVADPLQQLTDMAAAAAQCAVEHAAKGEGEVVARIAVGDREDVDFVQTVAGGDHPTGARDQRTAQRRGGQRGA